MRIKSITTHFCKKKKKRMSPINGFLTRVKVHTCSISFKHIRDYKLKRFVLLNRSNNCLSISHPFNRRRLLDTTTVSLFARKSRKLRVKKQQ